MAEHNSFRSQTSIINNRQPAYLEPIRNRMQKPIGSIRIGCFLNQKHVEKREGEEAGKTKATYPQVEPIYRGGISLRKH